MYNAYKKTLTDVLFDMHYPEHIQDLSRRHWTPVVIAEQAAEFLVEGNGDKILDIGSGVGKFCLAGAQRYPDKQFYGVEQRASLYEIAQKTLAGIGLTNVHFLHDNFTHLDFAEYDHFYFYNAFFENIDAGGHIDEDVKFDHRLYTYYSRKLYTALDAKPRGTRVVTYHSLDQEVPPSYQMVYRSEDHTLKMWIRQ